MNGALLIHWTINSIIISIILFCTFQGASFYVLGLTMVDMKQRLDTNYELLSDAILCRNILNMVGSVVGGYITDRYRLSLGAHQTFNFVSLGVVTTILSMVRSTVAAGICFAVCGYLIGVVNNGKLLNILGLHSNYILFTVS